MSDAKHAIRLTFTHGHLVGSLVAVTTIEGLVYEGILSSFGPEKEDSKDLFVCLSLARCAAPATQRTRIDDTLLVRWKDVMCLDGLEYKYEEDRPTKASFKKQMPNLLPPSNWAAMDFAEEAKEYQPGSFNQFEAPANKSATKDRPGYDERMYTTALPTNITEESRLIADRIAAEIEQEGQRDVNPRGDQDDATLYSDVTARAKYVPPCKRKDAAAVNKNNNATSDSTAAAAAAPVGPTAVGSAPPSQPGKLRATAQPFSPPDNANPLSNSRPPSKPLFFDVLKRTIEDLQKGKSTRKTTVLAEPPGQPQYTNPHPYSYTHQQSSPNRMGMVEMMPHQTHYNPRLAQQPQYLCEEGYSPAGFPPPVSYNMNNMNMYTNNSMHNYMNTQPPFLPPQPSQLPQSSQPPQPQQQPQPQTQPQTQGSAQGRGGGRVLSRGRGRAS